MTHSSPPIWNENSFEFPAHFKNRELPSTDRAVHSQKDEHDEEEGGPNLRGRERRNRLGIDLEHETRTLKKHRGSGLTGQKGGI